MGQPVDSVPAGVSDSPGVPAASKVSANQTVRGATGPIGILTDVPQFGGATLSGLWTVGALRCRINGIPVVHATSVGIGIASAPPPPSTGPLRLGQSDSKGKAL